MSSLDAMLKQYTKNTEGKSSNSNSSTYNEDNYFTTFIPEGESSITKRARILPMEGTPFVELYIHKTTIDGKRRTLICPKHLKNEKCAFCEARELLLATGKESDKELAKKYGARLAYVVKVIDRDDEAHGPKYWRFNHDYRNTGTLDKIMGIIKTVGHDITDAESGRDLTINVNRDSNGYAQISSIVQGDKSPLSEDAEKATEWLNHGGTWEDVYSVKSNDYLKIVVGGGVPKWDKENEKYIDANASEEDTTNEGEELNLGDSIPNQSSTPKPQPAMETSTPSSAPEADEEEPDDLPF